MATASGALRYARLRAPSAMSEQDSRCATGASSPATRSCNGLTRVKVEWHYIAPGKPIQNAFIESFNGRLGVKS